MTPEDYLSAAFTYVHSLRFNDTEQCLKKAELLTRLAEASISLSTPAVVNVTPHVTADAVEREHLLKEALADVPAALAKSR